MNAKKITRTTFKSFIRKNIGNLYAVEFSSFDGMCDCVMPSDKKLVKVTEYDFGQEYTLGIPNVWLCGRDSFGLIEYQGMHGIQYYNCCGSGAILTK